MDDQGKVEDLRREIAMIKELNDRYMLKKWPTDVDRVANEHRRVRLVEIIRELTTLMKAA